MKVLMLSPYPYEAAATRVRCAQYIPYLEAHGARVVLLSFMSTRLFRIVYRHGYAAGKLRYGLVDGGRRLAVWLRARRFDLIFLYREFLPVGPPLAEQLLAWLGVPLVLDFDDAIFLAPSSPANQWLNILKPRGKVPWLLRMSKAATVGNAFLARYAGRYQERVEVLPSSVDTELFRPAGRGSAARREKPVTLGWVGSPTTSPYLGLITQALQELARRYTFRVRVVGALEVWRVPGVVIEQHAWRLAAEVRHFQSLDIGLYPLPRTLWAEGKCGYKALQYWAVGIPVVCSPVGVLPGMVEPGVNGYLAETPDEWVEALGRLLENGALRRSMGEAGRAMVVARYSARVVAPRLHALFASVLEGA